MKEAVIKLNEEHSGNSQCPTISEKDGDSQQSLATARAVSDRVLEGIVLGNLGNAYNSQGDYHQAIEYYQ